MSLHPLATDEKIRLAAQELRKRPAAQTTTHERLVHDNETQERRRLELNDEEWKTKGSFPFGVEVGRSIVGYFYEEPPKLGPSRSVVRCSWVDLPPLSQPNKSVWRWLSDEDTFPDSKRSTTERRAQPSAPTEDEQSCRTIDAGAEASEARGLSMETHVDERRPNGLGEACIASIRTQAARLLTFAHRDSQYPS
jgi:hypothetical protein